VNATVGVKLVELGDVDCTLIALNDGANESNVLDNVVAAVLPLPAASCANPAAIDTDTAPCAVGVTLVVYVEPEPENPDNEPFVTVIEELANPVTTSENVIVTGIGLTLVVLLAVDVIVTVGATLSNV
jgi:hypothetical protein